MNPVRHILCGACNHLYLLFYTFFEYFFIALFICAPFIIAFGPLQEKKPARKFTILSLSPSLYVKVCIGMEGKRNQINKNNRLSIYSFLTLRSVTFDIMSVIEKNTHNACLYGYSYRRGAIANITMALNQPNARTNKNFPLNK